MCEQKILKKQYFFYSYATWQVYLALPNYLGLEVHSSFPQGRRGGLIYSCKASSSEFRAEDTPVSFTQKPLPARALPCCGRLGDLPPPQLPKGYPTGVRMEKSTDAFRHTCPSSGLEERACVPKNLFIFKMRLTDLFIRMKRDNVKGTVWECTYLSGGWSWGNALRQRREFILDLLIFHIAFNFQDLKKR